MSQDDMIFSAGQCVYSHGLDVTRNPSELVLMPELSRITSNTVEISSIFSPENGVVWYGTTDGKIKDANNNGTTIVDIGFSERIVDGCLFLGNFYVFTTQKVIRYTYTAGALS